MKQDFIDFVIKETEDTKIVLRFNLKNCHVHGFSEEPPKTWKEVYKVYYSYSIIEYWKEEKDTEDYEHIIYEETCDECSVLYEVWETLHFICTPTTSDYNNEYILIPIGYGTTWIIKRLLNGVTNDFWEFQLFQSHRTVNKGCQFFLNLEQMKKLKDTLKNFLDYTLAHSEGI